MAILLPLAWTIIFLFIIWRHPFFKIQGIAQWIILAFFVGKIGVSVVLNYIYTTYYPDTSTSDIHKYFNDALALFESIHVSVIDYLKILLGIDMNDPRIVEYLGNTNYWTRQYEYGFFTDNQTIIRVNMLVMFVSGKLLSVHYLFADFVSLFSFFLIYKAFAKLFKAKYILLFFIFLMPSSLLWTAGPLKESIVMLGLGLLSWGMVNTALNRSWKSIVSVVGGIILLLGIKIYVLVALVPAFVAYFANEKFPKRQAWFWYATIYGVGTVIIGICDFGLHQIPLFESFASKRSDFINTAIVENAGSYIAIGKIEPTVWDFISETPRALWNALALPYIWSIQSLMHSVSALESLLFFVLLALMIFFYKQPRNEQKNFIWFCIAFSLVLVWIIGITTPVVGAIVRYKMPCFPFLYTTFALLIDWDKIILRFKRKQI